MPMAQTCLAPIAMSFADTPGSGTGELGALVKGSVLPFPNCPYALLPQQYKRSSSSARAQAVCGPTAMRLEVPLKFATGEGAVVTPLKVPWPVAPLAFWPQQTGISGVVLSPHFMASPECNSTISDNSDLTGVGTSRSIKLPSPTSPDEFFPQQYSLSTVSIAHVP